ncbi:ORC ubiquitin ligase 1-like isoform X2 [Anneissia japonica]|uniref:ORC ubiquitin ligase 1-like isoform X2 n=1 Tax=Anneissia japonica TaxID=1529436 RepID=UPI0014255115|nr:ORC ubiquitin ligase 1-like isoform X2 [Anneissia japonica]
MATAKTIFSKASLSFTLPISCQICLCKVKEPLVCPNQHVFCTQCMQVWLEHNQHCPSCRVPITPDTPCKQIIGGPSPSDIGDGRFSTPALRKVRFEMMYKEYEDEITKLCDEITSLKKKNKCLEICLEESSKKSSATASQAFALRTTQNPTSEEGNEGKPSLSEAEPNDQVASLMKLTKNLEIATATYNQVKSDMDKLKQVNTKLKDENAQLLRENGRLKQDITRSPKKYEKYRAAAEHSRLLQCEKQVKQLRKALERSDNYIEELENQLEMRSNKVKTGDRKDDSGGQRKYKLANVDCSSKMRTDDQSTNQMFRGNSSLWGPEHTSLGNSSYLEKPSSVTPATTFSKLSLNSVTTDSAAIDKGLQYTKNSGQANSKLSCTRQLNFGHVDNGIGTSSNKYLRESNTTFDNLDYTLTDELSDCAKLMNEAAQRVYTRKGNDYQFSGLANSSLDNGDVSTSQCDSKFMLSIEHPYSLLSKSDFQFDESLPSCSTSTLGLNSLTSNPNICITIKQDNTSNEDSIFSTKRDFSMSSNGSRPGPSSMTSDFEFPHDLPGDATPALSGVSSTGGKEMLSSGMMFSSKGNLYGRPGRVHATSAQGAMEEEDGGLKRKTSEGYSCVVNSPSKATKSE